MDSELQTALMYVANQARNVVFRAQQFIANVDIPEPQMLHALGIYKELEALLADLHGITGADRELVARHILERRHAFLQKHPSIGEDLEGTAPASEKG
jgi:hypothetical protein